MRKLLTVLFLAASVMVAQEFRATLEGTVTDPNQAVVPGAQLTLHNVETSVDRQATTSGDGHYLFQFVSPGKYSLSTTAPGFRTDKRDEVQVNLGDTVRLDIQLVIGTANESIIVSANAMTVATDSSSLGALVRQDIVENLPLKGHGTLLMFELSAGVVSPLFPDDVRAIDQMHSVQYTSNGSPLGTGDVSVDGVSDMADVNRGYYIASYMPSSDSIAEFKMQTGTLPAEYGRSSGSISNILTKSGTNDLHGTMYESMRNSALDANSFFNNVSGTPLAVYRQNYFGFTVGGPVWLPKVYNGKNKTFFFMSYEGLRATSAFGGGRLNVPTAQMRTGDFSQVSTPIYDPYSVQPVNGVQTRTPLPGNIIPTSELDPVAKNVMQYWPSPNVSSSTSNPWVGDYSSGGGAFPSGYDFFNLKFDQIISPKQQIFVRANFGPGSLWNPYDFPGLAAPGRYQNKRPNQGATINDTYVFSPTVAAALRVGYQRTNNTTTPYSNGFDVGSLGFPSSFLKATQAADFPSFSFNDGMESLGQSGFANNPGQGISTEDQITVSRGKHMLKAGVDVRNLRGSQLNNSTPAGTFAFNSNQTGGPNAATPSGGFALASMLLGFGSSGSVLTAPSISWQQVYYGFYVQDDFRVSPKLTLNIGLRWEHESPRTERFDRQVVGFAYNLPTGIQVPGYTLNGGLMYPGKNGGTRGMYNPDMHNYSPRLGFAYSLNSKTVIRGGYSLMYIPIPTTQITTGYSITSPWVTSLDGGITVNNKLSNPLPNGPLPVTGSSSGLLTNLGQAISFADPGDTPPAFHNWHINVQRALPSSGLITIAYVGSRSIHLLAGSNVNINQVPVQDFALGSALTQTVANPFYGIFTAGSYTGTTIQQAQLLRPYPQFAGITRVTPGYGNAHYDALEFTYEKAMGLGLSGVAAFTWSKNLTDVFSAGNSPQNFYDRSTERGLADYDAPTRFSLALNWNIPLGRGRAFLHNMSRPLDEILGGWQFSTSEVFQDGTAAAFSVTGGTYFSDAIRPIVVGDPSQAVSGGIESRLTHYFNTAAFSRPANFTMGNVAPRIGSVRAPGMNNINLALGKTFEIYERVKAELRATAYNLPNHPVFSGPGTTVGSSSFGIISGQSNSSRQVEVAMKVRF